MTIFQWYDNRIIIHNPLDKHKSYLTISIKELNIFSGPKYKRTVLYSDISPDGSVILTNHGFLDKCIEICKKAKKPYRVVDNRHKFPFPKWAAISGLRGTQEVLLKKFLLHNRSGILEVPTRYGKSYLMLNILKAFPNIPTVIAMPGVDLIRQTIDKYKQLLPETRNIVGIGSGLGNKQGPDITIVSFDSLEKIDREGTRLLLVDEIHAGVSASRAPMFADFINARIYGFSATTSGRFDGADKLIIGLFGPILEKRTFPEAVAEGMICPITVFRVKVKVDPVNVVQHNAVYNHAMFGNESMQYLIGKICDKVIPKDWQTIVFIKTAKQAKQLAEYVDGAEIAVAGGMSKAQRNDLFDKMQNNEVTRCIATSIYAQGVTFSDLRVMINYSGGGGNTSTIQKPGRLAEVIEGKDRGYMFDFYLDTDGMTEDDSRMMIVRDDRARNRVYKNLGYEVVDIESSELNELTLQ